MNERDVSAYKVLGHSLLFAAHVAAEFPKDFAEMVARWEPDSMDAIIEALTEQKDAKEIEDFRARFEKVNNGHL